MPVKSSFNQSQKDFTVDDEKLHLLNISLNYNSDSVIAISLLLIFVPGLCLVAISLAEKQESWAFECSFLPPNPRNKIVMHFASVMVVALTLLQIP